jgi:hypothetical protein
MQDECKVYITTNLLGGIGNQLFQIAIAYATSQELSTSMLVSTKNWHCGQGSHPNKYLKSLYRKIKLVELAPAHAIVIQEETSHYYSVVSYVMNIVKTGKINNIEYSGYWQSEKYFSKFRNEIRSLFIPDEGPISYLNTNSDILNSYPDLTDIKDACFIGVRRGDYIAKAYHHNPCGMTYYNKAISKTNCAKYYVASDDIEWCKKKFIGDKFTFFDIKDDLEQLLVSTLFKTYIISNSTFYWWGSYLSIHCDNVTIYAPDKWCCPQYAPTIYTDKMIVLERPVESD